MTSRNVTFAPDVVRVDESQLGRGGGGAEEPATGGGGGGHGHPPGRAHESGGDSGESDDDDDNNRKPAAREGPRTGTPAPVQHAGPSAGGRPHGGDPQEPPSEGRTGGGTGGGNGGTGNSSAHDLFCPNCGSREIEQPHDASGASICTSCGVVVEENAIVSAVEYDVSLWFVEGAGGSSSMIGQFVSATSSKAYTGGAGAGGGGGGGIRGGAGRYGFSRDSREATLAHGRRRIQDIASRLRLSAHFVDAAHRLFTIAVEKNFVQGRRTAHVVAACLYIACRQEKSQHMLIDFSDALQTNVFTLGTCFLKFRRLLGLKLEIIDPALYVYRFAAHLNLNDKANAVALTALRLVGRMKRDWITAGRRPAGICAGALLIASRAHGFDRHHSDVTRILRVCGLTVTTRVREFERTPSAGLTLDEFTTVDLDAEADPPVFQRNRFKEARARAIADGDVDLLSSGALDDPGGGKRAQSWRNPGQRKNPNKEKLTELYASLDRELKEDGASAKGGEDATASLSETSKSADDKGSSDTTQQQVVPSGLDLSMIPDKWRRVFPKGNTGRSLVLPEHATEEERQAPTVPVELKINLEEWKRDLPQEVIDDIDSIFVSEEEERQKEVIFNRVNKDYLELQARKEKDRKTAEAASERREKEDAAQAEGHARYKISRRKRGAPLTDDATKTTEENLMESISTRKVSRRINYDALTSIFAEDGSFATDVAAHDDADPMFAHV